MYKFIPYYRLILYTGSSRIQVLPVLGLFLYPGYPWKSVLYKEEHTVLSLQIGLTLLSQPNYFLLTFTYSAVGT